MLDLDSRTLEVLENSPFIYIAMLFFCYAFMVRTRGVVSDRMALDRSYVALFVMFEFWVALRREPSRILTW